MLNLPNAQHELSQVLDLQKLEYANEGGKILTFNALYLENLSKIDNAVRLIFDHAHFKILFITENVETYLRHSAKDFLDSSALFPSQFLSLEHQNLLFIWLERALADPSKCAGVHYPKQVMCGVNVQHKDGHTLRLLFRHSFLIETKDVRSRFSIVTIDDISHLMRADFYWGRMAFGGEKRVFHHFSSIEKTDVTRDILTDKEKDILELFAQGREAKEIGKLLSISPRTVDKRRRDMLEKTGTKTNTGLIHICKMSGII